MTTLYLMRKAHTSDNLSDINSYEIIDQEQFDYTKSVGVAGDSGNWIGILEDGKFTKREDLK